MIDTDYQFRVLTDEQVSALRSLQRLIGTGNAAKGFRDEGVEILNIPTFLSGAHPDRGSFLGRIVEKFIRLFPAIERNYWMARISLIPTEAAEALEELRNGRRVNETWFSARYRGDLYAWNEGEYPDVLPEGILGKPEGVPSEIVDGIVRSFDIADEAKFDLAIELDRKLAYNATRARLHGKKA